MSESKRILLVEDSPNDVALTLEAFEQSNLAGEVDVVRDGQQALDYLHSVGEWQTRAGALPAVVLLDLKLPKLNGLEVLAHIKQHAHLRTLPVVMLTSSREESDLARSYGLGVNAYVVKPVLFSEFVTALQELGVFWALVNQPPPGSLAKPLS